MHFRHAAVAVLATAAALVAAGSASAQSDKPVKVAVINTEQILVESQTGKKAIAELKKLQDAKEAELKAKEQEIRDLQVKLNEGRLSLAQDKLEELQKQMEEKTIAGRRLQDDANRELGKKRDELLGGVDQKVMPLINQIGKEMGYTLIFRKFESGLIYADEAVDITKLVITRLDAAAK